MSTEQVTEVRKAVAVELRDLAGVLERAADRLTPDGAEALRDRGRALVDAI